MAAPLTFTVTGMTCEHCVNAVTSAVKETPGVADVQVSLEESRATVSGDAIDIAKVIAAIEEEGYKAALAS